MRNNWRMWNNPTIWVRMITNGARCTREIKSRVVIAITFTELLILSHITRMRQTGQGMVPFTQINL
jgi:hypothetical protein